MKGTASSAAEGEGVGDARCKEGSHRAAVAQLDATSSPLATSPAPPCLGTEVAPRQGTDLHPCHCPAHPRGTRVMAGAASHGAALGTRRQRRCRAAVTKHGGTAARGCDCCVGREG